MSGRLDDSLPPFFLHFREQDVHILDLVIEQPIVKDGTVAEELRSGELGEVGIHLVVAEVLAQISSESAIGVVAHVFDPKNRGLTLPTPSGLMKTASLMAAL